MKKIIALAPTRIDFAGAWTDVSIFADEFGGETLNAAITQFVRGEFLSPDERDESGISVSYHTDIPTGAGLGSSAAMNVVWLALMKGNTIQTLDEKLAIAEDAYRLEKLLGIVGGKQDQYASAVGGINLFQFTRDQTHVIPLAIDSKRLQELRSHLLLCYTGSSRLSSNIHEHVWGNFKKGDRRIKVALLSLRDSAQDCRMIIESGTLSDLGEILWLQFLCSKQLDVSTTNETIETLFYLVRDNIFGGKPAGAGGGGCVLFYCKDVEHKKTATKKILDAGFRILDFDFDFKGVQVSIEHV